MPDLPSIHTGIVLTIAGLALLLFATEQIRLESAALLVLLLLLLTFTVVPLQDPSGNVFNALTLLQAFGNEALVTVCALMILGKGIETTCALRPIVASISHFWSRYPSIAMVAVLLIAAALSAFMNNTPVVVVLLPALITIARKNRLARSKLLMPIGLVTIIGGMMTTIGTSTNLLVVSLARDISDVRFEMFDFASYVLLAGVPGVLYLWLVAPRILPVRQTTDSDDFAKSFIATLHIEPDSPLVGRTVADLLQRCGRSVSIDRIQHGEAVHRPLPTVTLHEFDRVFVRGSREALKEAEQLLQVQLASLDTKHLDDPAAEPLLIELLVTERSELDGQSLAQFRLDERYGIHGIALHRPELRTNLGRRALEQITLGPGDILLCEGPRDEFDRLLTETRLFAVNETTERPFTGRAPVALGIMALVVVSAATGWLQITLSALLGVGLMLATKCIGWRHVSQGLSTQVILIIVVSLALGSALMVCDGDVYLARVFNHLFEGFSPGFVVAALMLFIAALTNVVSNNAAAVIGTPVAVQIAQQLEVTPEPLILAVLFGANLSFATPIGYQTNLLVYSAGGYRFSDFVRVGLPLTLLMWAILSWLLKLRYGL